MLAVVSCSPLTKPRPSAAPGTYVRPTVCAVRRTAPSLTLNRLMVSPTSRRARAGSPAAPRGRHTLACSRNCSGVPLGRHTWTVWSAPLRITRRASRHHYGVGALGAGAHEALVGDTPHLDEALGSDPLMMCWPSCVTATAVTRRCHERGRASRRRYSRDFGVKADHKVHAIGQRRDAVHRLPMRRCARSAVERPQHAVPPAEPPTKRAPPGSTAIALTGACAGWEGGALHAVVAPMVEGTDGRAGQPVMMRRRAP